MKRVRVSAAGLAAAALSGAVAVLYLSLIGQGAVDTDGARLRVAVFAALFALLPILAALGSLRPDSRGGTRLLAVAATGMTVLGLLAIASIGLPLLLAAAAGWGAVIRSARGGPAR